MASPQSDTVLMAGVVVALALTLFLGLTWYMWSAWRKDVKAARLMERLLLVTTSEAFQYGSWDLVRQVSAVQEAINLGRIERAEVGLSMLEHELSKSRKGVES